MTGDPIHDLVVGEFRPDRSDRPTPCPIRSLVIDASLDGRERDLLSEIGLKRALSLVCDPTTHDVLGARIARIMPETEVIVIETPKADDAVAERLLDRTRHADALIAVGSGTINDLVKLASYRRRTPYAVFATAPSMNGYVTATASITRSGQKLSLPATPPLGAFFDLTILAEAPLRLIRAGVGDSLCRGTAEWDWRLSHHLLGTPFLDVPFLIQADDEKALLAGLHDLEKRDLDAMRALVRLLVLGGLGMLIAGSSQPGSQGEHLLSHYIDMLCRPHPGSLHGEQVGLTTWTMTALQHTLMTRERPPVLEAPTIDPTAMAERFGPLTADCVAALGRKTPSGDRLQALNRSVEDHWPALRAAFEARALPPDRLGPAFAGIGIPTRPEQLGVPRSFYREAVRHARELRDRFTALDLAAMASGIDPFIEAHLSG